jgi:hypothetical protein
MPEEKGYQVMEFPPMQAPETWNLDGILKQVQLQVSESPSSDIIRIGELNRAKDGCKRQTDSESEKFPEGVCAVRDERNRAPPQGSAPPDKPN